MNIISLILNILRIGIRKEIDTFLKLPQKLASENFDIWTKDTTKMAYGCIEYLYSYDPGVTAEHRFVQQYSSSTKIRRIFILTDLILIVSNIFKNYLLTKSNLDS